MEINLEKTWEYEARGLKSDQADPKVGDKVTVTFSSDSMNRMVRVCTVCNIVTFDSNSKSVQQKDIKNKSKRLRYEKMLKLEGKPLKVGMALPFRGRLEQGGKKKGDVKSVIYPVNQWMDSGENATEAAMARWAQDKELFCEDDAAAIKSAIENKVKEAKTKFEKSKSSWSKARC